MQRPELLQRLRSTCYLRGAFTLRSGITSEVYFDKYRFESDPQLLTAVAERMAPLVPSATQLLAGLELGGVPLAVALSLETRHPTVFVRKQAKPYGTMRVAEGNDVAGRRVLVVEDVITSGGQVVASAMDLRREGAHVSDVLCVIDREQGGREALAAEGLTLHAVATLAEIESA